jgi:NitT/TauT family transport system substrate-binding protein
MRNHRELYRLSVVIVAAVLSISSAYGQGAAKDGSLTTLRYASWGPKLIDQADFFVAEELGYFKEEGLKVEFLPSQGSGDALRNVLAGNADFASTGLEAILFGLDQGAKLKAFYNLRPQNQFTIVARKSLGINTPRDLVGKRIGVTSMASASRYNVMTILKGNRLNESDVTIVATGLNFAGPLEQGQIDAAGTWDTMNWDLMNRALPANIKSDLVVFRAGEYLNVSTDVYATSDEILQKKRDLLLRFLRAHRKGSLFMQANPEKAAEIAAKHTIAKQEDKERNLAIVKLRIWMESDEGTKARGLGWFTDKTMNDFASAYQQWGLVKNSYTAKDFVTNDLVTSLGK